MYKKKLRVMAYLLALMMVLSLLSPLAALASTVAQTTPVTNITLDTAFWRVGSPLDLNYHATITPAIAAGRTINWHVMSASPQRIVSAGPVSNGIITASDEGTVNLRATIEGQANFVRYFSVNFSARAIDARLEGLERMYINVPVNGRVLFTLDSGMFADPIFPADFWVTGLPPGLTAAPAIRLNNTQVAINITGTPNVTAGISWNLNVPSTVPIRNLRQTNVPVPIIRHGLTITGIAPSALISPTAATFDINPYGENHRDFVLTLQPRDAVFRNIRYGSVNLRANTDFTRDDFNPNRFTIHRSFLNRLPVGEWTLTFIMNRGANPVLTLHIIDTSRVVEYVPYIPMPAPPSPPPRPPHPNENFMFLSGGASVNLSTLRWDLNRARVRPVIQDGMAEMRVRANVLHYKSFGMAEGTTFEIMTPMARVRVPLDILNSTFGAREAIFAAGLEYNQVDLRIRLIDRSDDEVLNQMFEAVYPYGHFLSALVELLVQYVCVASGEVIHTAVEFARPVDMNFVVMDNAGHLRPAGVLFGRAWLEFVPYRVHSPNEITTSSIFPGVQAVIHNRIHFEDIYLAHWGFVQSYTAAYSGLVAPMPRLNPQINITRGEFAQLLAISLQLPRAGANISGFTDVPPPHVYFDGVSRLFAAGLLGPYVPGARFYPNAIITREEIAAIAGMALHLGEPVREQSHRPLHTMFTDYMELTFHHLENVQTALNYRIMVGYPDGTFRPQQPSTRIYSLQVVMNLARALGLIDEIP